MCVSQFQNYFRPVVIDVFLIVKELPDWRAVFFFFFLNRSRLHPHRSFVSGGGGRGEGVIYEVRWQGDGGMEAAIACQEVTGCEGRGYIHPLQSTTSSITPARVAEWGRAGWDGVRLALVKNGSHYELDPCRHWPNPLRPHPPTSLSQLCMQRGPFGRLP